MKKIIWIIIILAVAIGGYFAMRSDDSSTGNEPAGEEQTNGNEPQVVEEQETDSALATKLKTASVNVSESSTAAPVALVNGTATFTIEGSSDKATVTLDSVATQKGADVLAVANVQSGSAVSQYLLVFADSAGKLSQKSLAYLGEGLDVRSIVATDLGGGSYAVTVSTPVKKFIFVVEGGVINPAKSLIL